MLRRHHADRVFTAHGKEASGRAHHGGKFAGEGLQNIDEDDDMLSAMARELVERNGIGETDDAIWKALNAENQKLFPTASGSNGNIPSSDPPGTLIENQIEPASLVESALDNTSVVAFGQRHDSLSARRRRARGGCSAAGVTIQPRLNQAE